MTPMFKEGPIRSLLKGQGLRPASEWSNFARMSQDALPGELKANNLYLRLAEIARDLGHEDLAAKYEEIAKDEADHYRIISNEILPAISMWSGAEAEARRRST